jgi:hypothetical protein
MTEETSSPSDLSEDGRFQTIDDLEKAWRQKRRHWRNMIKHSIDGNFTIRWTHRPYDHKEEITFLYPMCSANVHDWDVIIRSFDHIYNHDLRSIWKIDIISSLEIPPKYEKRNLLEDLFRAEHCFTANI